MFQNVGNADRALRVIVGIALLSAFLFLEGNARWFALIGVVPLLTGLLGQCPLYRLAGLNTCPRPQPKM